MRVMYAPYRDDDNNDKTYAPAWLPDRIREIYNWCDMRVYWTQW